MKKWFLKEDFEAYQASESILISLPLVLMFYDADGGAHSITECYSILGVVQNNLLD